jgi:flavin-dependent dehydrogenase
MLTRPSALILGGGPAGAATAMLLARSGISVLVAERSREPHEVVCGGFVSGDALRILRRLGVCAADQGARPITRLRLVLGRRRLETPLPFPAVGLSRRTLDAALLQAAARSGARVERGLAARQVDPRERRVVLSDGAEMTPTALFLASGKHDVRGAGRVRRRRGDEAVGLRTRIAPGPSLARDLAEVIELHLFAEGYAGLLTQEDGSVNFCLSVSASRLRGVDGRVDQLVASLAEEAPALAERLDAGARIGAWSSIARVPYGFIAEHTAAGVFRVGDQAAVIASLAGDGVAVALHSAEQASAAFLSGGAPAAMGYQRALASRAAAPLRLASALRFAGERPRLAAPLLAAVGLRPGLLGLAARLTRL